MPKIFPDECKVTEWTDWSACSASCGQGVRIRTRNYLVVGKARSAQCSVTLIEKDSCDVDCVGDVSCATTPWTEWSECSVTCGKGWVSLPWYSLALELTTDLVMTLHHNSYRTRTRLFANRAARKICSQVDLVDTDPCFGVMSECTDTNLDQIDPKCMVTEWYVKFSDFFFYKHNSAYSCFVQQLLSKHTSLLPVHLSFAISICDSGDESQFSFLTAVLVQ
jgi:hypothetical protein